MTDFGMPTLIEISDLEQSAALCRRLGLRFMEINMSFPQYQPECLDADRLLELKEKYGIYFTVHIDESLDPACVNAGVAQAYLDTMLKTVALAKKAGIPVLRLPSGAGHDSAVLSNKGVPVSMIFIANQDGSHNPYEKMKMEDFMLGAEVLYTAIANF